MDKPNEELRNAMFRHGVSQARLAELLGRRREDINILLGVELADETKKEWLKVITEA